MDRNEHEHVNSLIHKTNVLLKFGMQECLRQFNITPDQWITLRTLYYKNGYLNQKELAASRLKEPAAMMRILELLEKKNYVERRKISKDKREQIIFITDEGRQLFEQAAPYVKKVEDIVDSTLDEDEMLTLIRLHEKLLKSLPFTK